MLFRTPPSASSGWPLATSSWAMNGKAGRSGVAGCGHRRIAVSCLTNCGISPTTCGWHGNGYGRERRLAPPLLAQPTPLFPRFHQWQAQRQARRPPLRGYPPSCRASALCGSHSAELERLPVYRKNPALVRTQKIAPILGLLTRRRKTPLMMASIRRSFSSNLG